MDMLGTILVQSKFRVFSFFSESDVATFCPSENTPFYTLPNLTAKTVGKDSSGFSANLPLDDDMLMGVDSPEVQSTVRVRI